MNPQPFPQTALRELCNLGSGENPGSYRDDINGKFPLMGANGQIGRSHQANFKDGVLVGRVGAAGYVNAVTGEVWASDNTLTVHGKPGGYRPELLVHLLNFLEPWTLATRNAQPLVTQTNLGEMDAPQIPDAEQARVAEVLDTLDRAIFTSEGVVTKIQSVKVATARQLLEHGVDQHGVAREPSGKNNRSGWVVRPMMDIVELPSGQVDPRREPFSSWILVAPDHMESGTGQLLQRVTASEQGAISGKYLFLPGDVLYSKIRPYLRKAVLSNFQGLCSADVYPLRPREGVNPRFLLELILGEKFSAFAESVSMRSGFPKINREELAEYRVAIPPIDEQNRIALVLSAIDERLQAEQANLAKLWFLKSGLSADLLTGRVRTLSH